MKLVFLALLIAVLALQEYGVINIKNNVNTILGKLTLIVIVFAITKQYGFVLGFVYAISAIYLLNGVKEGMSGGMNGNNNALEDINFNDNKQGMGKSNPEFVEYNNSVKTIISEETCKKHADKYGSKLTGSASMKLSTPYGECSYKKDSYKWDSTIKKPVSSGNNLKDTVTVHESNNHSNLFYYIPPKTMGEIEETRMKNKQGAKTSSSDRLFIEELLKNNKIHNIVINFNRGNKSPLSKQKIEPKGSYYKKQKPNKLKADPYSCSA